MTSAAVTQRKWAQKNILMGRCRDCVRPAIEGGRVCPYHLEYHRAYRKKRSLEAFEAYGGAHCACCQEDRYEFLTLDHILGDGAQDRRRRGRDDIVSQLRTEGYPPGFQVLCMNCNFAKGMYGQCPHDRHRSQPDATDVLRRSTDENPVAGPWAGATI